MPSRLKHIHLYHPLYLNLRARAVLRRCKLGGLALGLRRLRARDHLGRLAGRSLGHDGTVLGRVAEGLVGVRVGVRIRVRVRARAGVGVRVGARVRARAGARARVSTIACCSSFWARRSACG